MCNCSGCQVSGVSYCKMIHYKKLMIMRAPYQLPINCFHHHNSVQEIGEHTDDKPKSSSPFTNFLSSASRPFFQNQHSSVKLLPAAASDLWQFGPLETGNYWHRCLTSLSLRWHWAWAERKQLVWSCERWISGILHIYCEVTDSGKRDKISFEPPNSKTGSFSVSIFANALTACHL